MNKTLARTSSRYLLRHPWQTGLALLGIALGVGVVIAIDIVQHTAAQSFSRSTRAVAGSATHQIVGGPNGIEEQHYAALRRSGTALAFSPVIDSPVRLPSHPGESLRLLGIDPVATLAFSTDWQLVGAGHGPFALTKLMTHPAAVALPSRIGKRLGISPGEMLTIQTASGLHQVKVTAWLGGSDSTETVLDGHLVTDIATAQELLGRLGRLDRIDVILPEQQEAAALAAQLHPSLQLLTTGTRLRSVQSMTRAFNTNLDALSLLSLLVGMFLIYNTQTFLVLQRREQFGVLRALGLKRSDLLRMVLTEALVLGIMGSALGVALGIALAHYLLGYVNQTINDLYYSVILNHPTISLFGFVRGLLLGISATLLAAAAPAIEASRVSPRVAMSRVNLEHKMHGALRALAGAGLFAILLGFAVMLIPGKSIVVAFISLFAIILGATFVTPATTSFLIRSVQPCATRRFGVLGTLAVRTVTASLSRTGVAVAALMLAVATTIGVGLMIGSFRTAVADWLGTVLQADFYITETQMTPRYTLNPTLMDELSEMPEIAAVSSARHLQIESERGIDQLVAYQLTPQAQSGFRFKGRTDAAIWQRLENSDSVVISEPYAYHNALATGDSLSLHSDHGEWVFRIAGVYFDYGTDQGVIAMSRRTYERHWDDREISGIGIYLASDISTNDGHDALTRIIDTNQSLQLHANRQVLDASLAIFDRTFAITDVLRTLAASIAFIGILGALMALQLERTAEFGMYRALGLTATQIRCLVVSETGLMGLVAGLIAIPVGIVMATSLVYVINVRSFGWTMDLALAPSTLLSGVALAIAAALLAGLYPAQRMATIEPAAALRTE